MSAKVANIAKNASFFTFALILQKVISFSYFIILARALNPEILGKYYLAISFTTIFAIFIDIGLANVLTREVAKDQEKTGKLLNNVLSIKLILSILTFLSLFIIANLLNYPAETVKLIYLASIPMILDSFTISFYACVRGHHNLLFESIASVAVQLIIFIFGFTVLQFTQSLFPLLLALIAASIFNFFYSLILVIKKLKIKIKPEIDVRLVKLIFGITVPFALFAIFQRIYVYLDTVLLSIFAGDEQVGLYQIAFKIIFALQFLPMAFTASLYPAFANYWANNKQQLSITFERAMNYLIIISVPISAGIIILADKIILLFKPEYMEAVWPLRLIMLALIFIFTIFPVGSLLNACDRQAVNTKIMGAGLALSVIMNLILIPRWQAIGASLTVAASNLFMLTAALIYAPRIIKIDFYKIFKVFLKVLLAASYMGILAFRLKSDINIFLVIIISGFVYFLLLYLLGGFRKEDIASIWNSFIKKSN